MRSKRVTLLNHVFYLYQLGGLFACELDSFCPLQTTIMNLWYFYVCVKWLDIIAIVICLCLQMIAWLKMGIMVVLTKEANELSRWKIRPSNWEGTFNEYAVAIPFCYCTVEMRQVIHHNARKIVFLSCVFFSLLKTHENMFLPL